MKRIISTLLLVALAGSVFASAPAPSPFDPTAARKSLSNVVPATGRAALDVYSKEESDALAAQSTLRYYFREADSDIAGFEAFATSPVAVQASEAKTLGTSIALVDQWITPANTPNLTTLVTGIYEMEMYFSTPGAGSAYIVPELWIYTAAGAEKQHVATDSTKIISGVVTKDLQTFRFSVPAAVSLASTDRLVIKLYAYRVGVQSLVIWYGGATDAFFGVPISPRNFLRTDGSNPSDLATVKNNLQIPNNASFTFDGLSGEVTYADFDELADTPAYEEGRVFWDKDNGTLGMYSDVDGSALTTPILQIGQEHWIRIKNAGVATLTNGTVVCLSSPLTGSDPIALIADASDPDKSRIVGVVTADIPPDGTGFATALGLVRNLNTEGFTEGSKIFLSATTPGSFTATLPAAPALSLIVGYVVKAHATVGSIYVRIWLNGSIERSTFAANQYFTGSSSGNKILQGTSDGSDVSVLAFSGGGDATYTRGAGMALFGNEHAISPGKLDLFSGTGGISIKTNGGERMTISSSGTIDMESMPTIGGANTIGGHIANTSNPHSVTYDQTGAEAAGTTAGHAMTTSTHGKTTLAGMEDIDDLSGVTNATAARSALGLGTMAVATAANYLDLAGTGTMVDNVKFSGAKGLIQTTSDGSDNSSVAMSGGGAASTDRGGFIEVYGNEHAIYPGIIRLQSVGAVEVSGQINASGGAIISDRLSIPTSNANPQNGDLWIQ